MQITVKNFGAIQSGKIDLSKRITLFCGPNCSGKTYMAYLLYGVFSLNNRRFFVDAGLSAEDLYAHKQVEMKISKSTLDTIRKYMLQRLKRNLDSLFGLSEEDVTSLFGNMDLSFTQGITKFYNYIISIPIQTTISAGRTNFLLDKQKGSDIVYIKMADDKTMFELPPSVLSRVLTSSIYKKLITNPIGEVAIFPVERNSVYTFSKELSIRKQEKWDQMQVIFDRGKNFSDVEMMVNSSNRYSLPIKDNLLIADDIVEIKKKKSEYYDFAENIEKELLQGKVVISNDGDIQFQPSHSEKITMPIQISASIVKSMSSLIVYLKHIAQKNDLIIIDEPEINLHPENQIILARTFANLANAGFRLLISTHSDYIIREFNNMIMGYDRPEMAKKKKYKIEDLIDKEDVTVYYFSPSQESGKSTINLIPIEDYGFEVPSIDRTIIAQNEILELFSYDVSKKRNK